MAILKVDTISGIGTEGPVFEGDIEFTSQNFLTLPKGDTTQRGRGRAVFFSGNDNTTPSAAAINNNIDFIEIQTLGNTVTFGDSINPRRRRYQAAGSSSTRGVNCGGFAPAPTSPSRVDTIEFITLATQSNSTDFGNLTEPASDVGTVSNGVRAVSALGIDNSTFTNVINFFTIATTGNASDFGDTASGAYNNFGCLESPTRGVYVGGNNNTPSPSTQHNRIDFVTIATTGNTQDFGDLTGVTSIPEGTSSITRGIIRHGQSGPTHTNTIDFITIASAGNATDFGDSPFFSGAAGGGGSVTNRIRAVFAGGYGQAPSYTIVNGIEFLTIATTGNSLDFGDIDSGAGANKAGCSDSHGGLTE